MNTQEKLLTRYSENLYDFEAEMIRQYGDRYIEYRKKYNEAGNFKYVPEFPLYIMLEQTYRCNLKCPMCIHGHPEYKSRFDTDCSIMPRDLFEQIILEGEKYGCPSIAFHVNDEPLLVNDLAGRVAFAKKHGFMDIFMTTNGNLLNKDIMKALVDAGVTRILFSLDAATKETYDKVRPNGNFSKVMNNLDTLLKYKKEKRLAIPAVRVSFVINKMNIHEVELFIKTFSGWVDYIEVQGFSVYYDINKELIPPNAKRVVNFLCNEPYRKLIIRNNGDVLPCCSFYGYEIVLGNLRKTSLKDIFQSGQCSQLRKEFKEGIYRLPACLACSNSFYKV